jgi:hypothetical protein
MNMRLFLLITSMSLAMFFSIAGIMIIYVDVAAADTFYISELKMNSLEYPDPAKKEQYFIEMDKISGGPRHEGKWEFGMSEYMQTLLSSL